MVLLVSKRLHRHPVLLQWSQRQPYRSPRMFPSPFHRGLAMQPQSEGPDTSHAEVDAAPVRVCERVPAAGPTRADAAASMVTFNALGSLTPLAMTSGLTQGK